MFEAVYDVYGFRPLTSEDIRQAFSDGTVALNASGAFDVTYREWEFELFDAGEVASRHFMDWLAEQKGAAPYTHAYRANIVGYTDDDMGDRLAALAARIGGTLAVTDSGDGSGYITDAGVEYAPPPTDIEAQPGRALALTWYGRLGMCQHPMGQWIKVCEERFPEFTPKRFDVDNRPVTEKAKAWLKTPDSWLRCEELWDQQLLGGIVFSRPFAMIQWPDALPANALYSISCHVMLDTLIERGQMTYLNAFFDTIARELRTEVASCEVLAGYEAKKGLAEFTLDSEKKQWLGLTLDFDLLGLMPAPVWWLWLGPDYSRLLSKWLHTSAPSSWSIDFRDDSTCIRTSPTPARRKELRSGWLPREFLARKKLFGRNRQPAKSLPPWATT